MPASEDELLAGYKGPNQGAINAGSAAPAAPGSEDALLASYKNPSASGKLAHAMDDVQHAAKGVDWITGAGSVRALLGTLGNHLTGKQIITPEESSAALNPLNKQGAPGMATMLERAGVGPGPSVSDFTSIPRGSALDFTTRGVGGAVADAVLNPKSMIEGGLSLASKMSPWFKGAAEEAPTAGAGGGLPAVIKQGTESAAGKGDLQAVKAVSPDTARLGPDRAFPENNGQKLLGQDQAPALKGGLPATADPLRVGPQGKGPEIDLGKARRMGQQDTGPQSSPQAPTADIPKTPETPQGSPFSMRLYNAITNPVSMASDAGRAIYRKGVAPMLAAGQKYGKGDMTDWMMDQKIKGSPAAMAEQVGDLKSGLGDQMGDQLKAMSQSGVKTDYLKALQPYADKIKEMTNTGRMTVAQGKRAMSEALSAQMEYVAKNGKDVPAELMNKWRQDLDANQLAQNVFQDGSKTARKMGNELNLTRRAGMNNEIDRAVGEGMSPEAANQFRQTNQNWGKAATILPTAKRLANTALNQKIITPWDAAWLAGGAGLGYEQGGGRGSLEGALGALALKKGIQASQSPQALTNLGLGMKSLGDSPWASQAASNFLYQRAENRPTGGAQ